MKPADDVARAATVALGDNAALAFGAADTVAAATLAKDSDVAPRARLTGRAITTVLPRIEDRGDGPVLAFEARRRYAPTKLLGEGGMGTVELALDQDIARYVALKRMRPDIAEIGVARFVEEVRTIGQLEHPNIVPIHDVGLDEEGRFFFVMKYVEGQTLEEIIEALAAGDPEAHRRFSFEVRVQIFIGLLRALAYAHDRGIIHRDVKPANVMVGPYGEVILMDWGIARAVSEDAKDPPIQEEAAASADAPRRRLVETAHAQLVGTPAYMAPEQAQGRPDLDARCDLYAACAVFHELMTLRHYLEDACDLDALLSDVITRPLPPPLSGAYYHPTQGNTPAEYVYFLQRGMAKRREERFGSAREMIAQLEQTLEGKVRVQCHITMVKRMTREAGRFVDRRPRLAFTAFVLAVAAVLGAVALLLVMLARHLSP